MTRPSKLAMRKAGGRWRRGCIKNRWQLSLENAFYLPVQHVPQTVLPLEQTDVLLHIFVCLCDRVGHPRLVHQPAVLLVRLFAFGRFEIGLVVAYRLLLLSLLLEKLGEVVGAVGD